MRRVDDICSRSFPLVRARSRSLFPPVEPVIEVEKEIERIQLEEE